MGRNRLMGDQVHLTHPFPPQIVAHFATWLGHSWSYLSRFWAQHAGQLVVESGGLPILAANGRNCKMCRGSRYRHAQKGGMRRLVRASK